MLVININLLTLIISENCPSILSTRFNITSVSYFCKTTFLESYPISANIYTEELPIRILNWAHRNFLKKYPLNNLQNKGGFSFEKQMFLYRTLLSDTKNFKNLKI